MAAALLVSVGGPSFNRQLPKQFPGRLPIAASPARPRGRGGLKRVNALTAISSPAGARLRPAGWRPAEWSVDVRFGSHSGLNSDIASCPDCADIVAKVFFW